MVPANLLKALTHESCLHKFKACLEALNHTATGVPVKTDKAIRDWMHTCDGNGYVSADTVSSRQQVMEVVREKNGTAITISLCCDCYITHMGRKLDEGLPAR